MSFERKLQRRAEKRAREQIAAMLEIGRKGPQPGDVLAGCVHRPRPNGAHYFYAGNEKGEPNLRLENPKSGGAALAEWIVLCDECFTTYAERIQEAIQNKEVPLAFVSTWQEEDGKIVFYPS